MKIVIIGGFSFPCQNPSRQVQTTLRLDASLFQHTKKLREATLRKYILHHHCYVLQDRSVGSLCTIGPDMVNMVNLTTTGGCNCGLEKARGFSKSSAGIKLPKFGSNTIKLWIYLQCGGPHGPAKLVSNSNNYGLWYLQLQSMGSINQQISPFWGPDFRPLRHDFLEAKRGHIEGANRQDWKRTQKKHDRGSFLCQQCYENVLENKIKLGRKCICIYVKYKKYVIYRIIILYVYIYIVYSVYIYIY